MFIDMLTWDRNDLIKGHDMVKQSRMEGSLHHLRLG